VAIWRGWFIATGSSAFGGGVWLSQDAAHWERVPVKKNGFDAVGGLSVITNDTTVLVAGTKAGGGGPLTIWKAA
jgi:hypothetical protein